MTDQSRLPNPAELRQMVRRILEEYKGGKQKEEIIRDLTAKGWDSDSIEHLIGNIEQTHGLSSPSKERRRAEWRGALKFTAIALYAICIAFFAYVPEASEDQTLFHGLAIAFGVAAMIVTYLWRSWLRGIKR